MKERSLIEWLQIVGELKPVYSRYEADPHKGNTAVIVTYVTQALDVLVKHEVTIQELLALAKTVGPILELVKGL